MPLLKSSKHSPHSKMGFFHERRDNNTIGAMQAGGMSFAQPFSHLLLPTLADTMSFRARRTSFIKDRDHQAYSKESAAAPSMNSDPLASGMGSLMSPEIIRALAHGVGFMAGYAFIAGQPLLASETISAGLYASAFTFAVDTYVPSVAAIGRQGDVSVLRGML